MKAHTQVQCDMMFSKAWDECIELQCTPKDRWVQTCLYDLSLIDRVEVAVWVDGKAIGGLILAPDYDIHVGKCISVLAQYVLPEYRNTGISGKCMRKALSIAREGNYPVLAFTHRVSDWKYNTIYRRLK